MLRIRTSVSILIFLLFFGFATGSVAQQNLPPDANQIKTPEEAKRGGMGLYLAMMGLKQLKEGKNEEAMKTLKEAIKLKSNYADAHEGLGRAQGNLNLWPEAAVSFQEAIRLKPDFLEAYIGAGFAYGALGRNREALKAFDEAVRLKPSYPFAHWGLASTYLAMGDRDSALKEYRIIQTLNPDMARKFEKYLATPGK